MLAITMQSAGYKGLFGLDFVIDKSGQVFLIEINARQPASTGFHTKLLLKESKIPLNLLHIAEFLFENDEESNKSYIEFINEVLIRNSKKDATTIYESLTVKNIKEILQKQNESELKPKEASH
jgi:predicted ATP-grasp superfamily ATP-dependent carboligase